MKIGILSMQMVDNYGSLLQAYALKRTLESLGATAEFINIHKNYDDYSLVCNYDKSYTNEFSEQSFLSKLLSKNALVRVSNKIKKSVFKTECKNFRNEFLKIDKTSDRYDLCVIGSDEVFNCLQPSPWGYTSQLFGNVPEANKVITYAASCGWTSYEKLPKAVIKSISESITKISAFSVRDNNTYDFIKNFGIKGINKNTDPALLYNFDKEIENAKLPKLPQKYCIIYSYTCRFNRKDEIDAILAFCKKNKLTPISLQGGQAWCKNYIPCSPFECLKIFKFADFVITDTFHGAIFSAKYAKKFAVISRESNYFKLYDLVNSLGIEKHLLKDISKLESIYRLEKEEETINNILNIEKERTCSYLRKYINGAEQV